FFLPLLQDDLVDLPGQRLDLVVLSLIAQVLPGGPPCRTLTLAGVVGLKAVRVEYHGAGVEGGGGQPAFPLGSRQDDVDAAFTVARCCAAHAESLLLPTA